jgi:CBS domain containing-hemolysin-like protein
MKEDNSPFFTYTKKLLDHPRRLLITIIAGNDAANIMISVIATSIFISIMGVNGKWVAAIVTTIVLLIFGEAIPKTFAVSYPLRLSGIASLPLTLFSIILRPLVWVLEKISGIFSSSFEGEVATENMSLTEDEFRELIDAGHKEGALEESQKDLIHRVFELANTTVSSIMVPRVDMFCLPVDMSPENMAKEIIKARYSRVPIYGTDKDNILGILHARHFLREISEEKKLNCLDLLKRPYFVPEEKMADGMLNDFQMRKVQMAIVVDEYGGVAGLVTLTDILKDLFGNIYNEYDPRENLFSKIGENMLMVSGVMDIEDFNKITGLSISDEEFDTIGGFVFHLFGKLPTQGEEIEFEGHIFRAEEISGARILQIRITKKGKDDR